MDAKGVVVEVASQAQLKDIIKSNGKAVLNFWADWCEPAKQMNQVFAELAKAHPSVAFLQVEAEKQPEISEEYEIKAVPYFIFVSEGKVIEVVEGANPPELTKKAASLAESKLQPAARPPAPVPVAQPAPVVAKPVSETDLNARLEKLVNTAPVMLFMKGDPNAPRCGFSSKMVALLNDSKVKFSSFDILTDNAVREGLKSYSNWPTYPQLYIDGKLVGGLDIVKELKEEGELADMIPQDARII